MTNSIIEIFGLDCLIRSRMSELTRASTNCSFASVSLTSIGALLYAKFVSLLMSWPNSGLVSVAFWRRSRNCALYNSVWLAGANLSSNGLQSEVKSFLESPCRLPKMDCALPFNDTAKCRPFSCSDQPFNSAHISKCDLKSIHELLPSKVAGLISFGLLELTLLAWPSL